MSLVRFSVAPHETLVDAFYGGLSLLVDFEYLTIDGVPPAGRSDGIQKEHSAGAQSRMVAEFRVFGVDCPADVLGYGFRS